MSRAAPLTFYEFFAGGGMARLGLGGGWRCLFANDFDPGKAAAYRDNFADASDHFHEGDVWAVSPVALPGRADLAWASSPCQDFSLAGARAGLVGGRSSAVFGFWRLVEGLVAEGRAPRMVVLENVVGLLTSHGGADFTALCRAFAEQGYRFGAIETNASGFLPQSRPRLFVVAVRQDEAPPAGEPGEPGEPGAAAGSVRRAYGRLPPELQARWLWWAWPAPPRPNLALADVLEPDGAVVWRSKAQTDRLLAQVSPAHLRLIEQAMASGERRVAAVFRRMRVEKGVKVQRAEVRFDGLAGCLRTPKGGSSRQFLLVIEDGEARSRLLTAREGARLMGLPEDYRLPKSQSAAWKVVGDGVAVPVVRWLAAHLLEPALAPTSDGRTGAGRPGSRRRAA